MEMISEQSLARSWHFKRFKTGPPYRSNQMKEDMCQSEYMEAMDPLTATKFPTGAFSGASTRASLAHNAMIYKHYSLADKERISTIKDSSSYNHSTSKLSKKGWILPTNEVLNGQNGCYLSGSYTCSSGITDDHLIYSSSSAHSICDELFQLNPKSTLSPTSSTVAYSDGSPSTEGIGSTEGNHSNQMRDDFMFELGWLGDWPIDETDLGFACPSTPQNMPYESNSGNSSGGSNEGVTTLYSPDDLSLPKTSKEYEVVSRSPLDPEEQVYALRSAAIWENPNKFDGLEEIFTPKIVHENARSLNSAIPLLPGGSNTCLRELPYSAGSSVGNGWQNSVCGKGGSRTDGHMFAFNSSNKRRKCEGEVLKGMYSESASKINNQFSTKTVENNKFEDKFASQASKTVENNKFEDKFASQAPGPISLVNNAIQSQWDNTSELGLNPILVSSPETAKSELNYRENCLVHLLIAGAEAVATRNMDLASVILVRLRELVSFSGSTMQRVAAYFSDGLQSRIEGNSIPGRSGTHKSHSDLLAAFQILHEISPYIKFGHFTANQALLEAVEGEKSVHVVDFEIMEGIQWPPFMQALVSRKGGPPHLRITALYRPHTERGLAAVQETGKRLGSFAASLNLPFIFNEVRVNNEEEFNVSSIKLVKGEALAVNCVLHLPHMPQRTASSVASFLNGMRRLSPTVLTLVEEELGCSAMAVASYFLEAFHHYSSICDSLEACLSSEAVARMLVERVFFAPRINSTVMFWSQSSAQIELGTEFATFNWCSLVRSVGFKSLPLSFQNLSQARLLLGLYKDGFKLEERSNRLLLAWRAKPLFAASVWN